jgi:transcriptional antiterminator RfaH
MDCKRFNTPRWYVIHTQPREEDRAESNLRAWQVETFYPKYRVRRCNEFSGRPTYHVKSLFPQYIFGRFQADCLVHKVSYTRGVRSIVNFGEGPVSVDDQIVQLLKSQTDEEGFVKIEDNLKAGDKVMVQAGPLKGLLGIFERKVKDSERVMILLTCVSFQGRMVLEKDSVTRVQEFQIE